jgi:hypothetical protein
MTITIYGINIALIGYKALYLLQKYFFEFLKRILQKCLYEINVVDNCLQSE